MMHKTNFSLFGLLVLVGLAVGSLEAKKKRKHRKKHQATAQTAAAQDASNTQVHTESHAMAGTAANAGSDQESHVAAGGYDQSHYMSGTQESDNNYKHAGANSTASGYDRENKKKGKENKGFSSSSSTYDDEGASHSSFSGTESDQNHGGSYEADQRLGAGASTFTGYQAEGGMDMDNTQEATATATRMRVQ